MSVIEITVTINKPVREVYARFMNESRMREWLTGFKSIETISGIPREVGSKHKLIFEEKGKEVVFIEEVTAIRDNEEFAFTLNHPIMESHSTIRFQAEGNQTIVTSITNTRAKKFLWKLMMPVMKGQMKKRQQQDYNKLKRMIEAS